MWNRVGAHAQFVPPPPQNRDLYHNVIWLGGGGPHQRGKALRKLRSRVCWGPFGADATVPDVENVSPNSFKKMYTDHKKVAQRKCLLMHVPSLGIRRFDPQNR